MAATPRTPGRSPLYFLAAEDPELDRAWRTLADPVEEDPETGERWQYMGTIGVRATAPCTGSHAFEHEFRHRACPSHGGRRFYLAIPSAPGWKPAES